MAYTYLKSYVTENFPALQKYLTGAQYEQLDWLQENSYITNELATLSKPAEINIEIRRSLVRLNCLQLLRSGTEQDYQAFITQQAEPKLAFLHFQELASAIQKLNETNYLALWVASITTKSATASELAASAFAEKNLSYKPHPDSVIFLAQVMVETPEIYPAAKELLVQRGESVKKAFATIFATGHFRHMLYTEGSSSMFALLKEKLRAGDFTDDDLSLWGQGGYWGINICGFRGHIEPRGSVYLNDDTYKGMAALNQHLTKLLENPDYAILPQYLLERASWLGSPYYGFWESANKPSSYILGHLAAMLRIYGAEQGQQLINGLQSLKQKIGETHYQDILIECDPTKKDDMATPTYAPAVFANIYSKTKDYAKAIELGLPLYAQALKTYRAQLAKGHIAADIPLNLNGIAASESIDLILTGQPVEVTIDPNNGSTKLTPIKLEIQAAVEHVRQPVI